MEINGVPLHPLVVHAAVVFTPLAALVGIGYAVPGWRDRLRWPLVVLVVIAAVAVWVAYLSGQTLRTDRFSTATGEFADRLDTHQTWGTRLRGGATAFAALALITVWLHDRSGPARVALVAATALAALLTLVLVVLTGDAGARATWAP
ncbi:DUF2231 domain-containing protein [Nocardioides sp. YIM 152588]|uniref:DUF2231 domain-containing protein n=1 Tax=Nocardioides sp. YIM 152588 TaxID=3158259 RepID=UPI0032E4B84C